jgi:protocatechuate 3,4-dioxygenase beta subunit
MAHIGPLEDHDKGLSHDLPVLLSRRRALTVFGSAGLAVVLAGCGGSGSNGSSDAAAASATSSSATSSGARDTIPEETAGPYPGDGSNGVNVLTESGIVRSDVTKSFGAATGVAVGVPLTLELTVLNTSNRSAGYEGAAVYLWHCNIDGQYSLYTDPITEENYLRGVQAADGDGLVTFTSIYPGAYSGRWPHIHFEVYPSLDAATRASGKLRTSQIALPEDACKIVYATDGYTGSAQNMVQTSLDGDNVFSDGYSLQLATVTGAVEDGLTAMLKVPV